MIDSSHLGALSTISFLVSTWIGEGIVSMVRGDMVTTLRLANDIRSVG